MNESRELMILTGVLIAGVVACGGTEPEGASGLTEEQAVAMFTAMKGLEIARESTGTFVDECPDGGEAELVGGVEVERFLIAIVVTRDYTVTPRGCVVDTGNGNRFTLAGETGFRSKLRIVYNFPPGRQRHLGVTGAMWGYFTWTTGDRTEECEVDLRVSNHSTDPDLPVDLEFEGDLCGFEVELEFIQEYSITTPPGSP